MSTAHAKAATHHAAHDPLAPVFAQYPLDVVRGEGVWLYGRDGRRVLDLYGGHAVAALGYGHPAMDRALAEQARAVNFQSNAVPMDVRTRAAQRLIAFSKLPVSSVFFVNSGAEANENALKMAFTLNPGRTEVVALDAELPRPHRRRGRAHLGCREEVVWLSAHALRREVPGARAISAALAADHRHRPRRSMVEPIQGVGGAFDLGARLPEGPAQDAAMKPAPC